MFENAASAVLFATSQTKQATLQRNDFDRNTAGAVHGLHPLVHAATEGSLPAVGPLGAIGAARAASARRPARPGRAAARRRRRRRRADARLSPVR